MDRFDLDEKYISDFRHGKDEIFSVIYNGSKEKLFQYTLRYVKDPEMAYDIVQDTYIKLWENRQKIVNADNLSGFLFITAKNMALNCLKRAAIDEGIKQKIINAYQFPSYSEVDRYITDKEYAKYISDLLDKLPQQTKLVFKKCKLEGLSYDEVAVELNISRNTVKKHMTRALTHLRQDETIKSISHNTLLICVLLNF